MNRYQMISVIFIKKDGIKLLKKQQLLDNAGIKDEEAQNKEEN